MVENLLSHKGHICRIYQLLQNHKKKDRKPKRKMGNRYFIKENIPWPINTGKVVKTYQLPKENKLKSQWRTEHILLSISTPRYIFSRKVYLYIQNTYEKINRSQKLEMTLSIKSRDKWFLVYPCNEILYSNENKPQLHHICLQHGFNKVHTICYYLYKGQQHKINQSK